jgi:hypothetical protein
MCGGLHIDRPEKGGILVKPFAEDKVR